MSLTADQITAGATYTVRLDPRGLSAKRFGDARRDLKEIARYNGDGTWTAEVAAATTETVPCTWGWHHGSRAAYHTDSDGQCVECHGAGQVTRTETPGAVDTLRWLIRSYDAVVTCGATQAPAASRPARGCTGLEYAEYADGFSPEERAAFGDG